jgi:hypothetical protein
MGTLKHKSNNYLVDESELEALRLQIEKQKVAYQKLLAVRQILLLKKSMNTMVTLVIDELTTSPTLH